MRQSFKKSEKVIKERNKIQILTTKKMRIHNLMKDYQNQINENKDEVFRKQKHKLKNLRML